MAHRLTVVLVVIALAFLASYGVWANTRLIRRAAIVSCRTTNDSNEALVMFLRRTIEGPGPNHDATVEIIDKLERNDRAVYADCLAKVP